MVTTAEPLLAQQVIAVSGTRSHYYRLPQIIVADVLEEEGENLIVKTEKDGEFKQPSSGVWCVHFPEDVEKAIALRDVFQKALDDLADGLTALMRYDKALADSKNPKNPLTPTIIAAEDPEGGESQNGRSEQWIFYPVERVEIVRHIEGQGLQPKHPDRLPIPFQNAFPCDGDEEWDEIFELSEAVNRAQLAFLGHLRSLESYYFRQHQQAEKAADVEIVGDDDDTQLNLPSVSDQDAKDALRMMVVSLGGINEDERQRLERILLELEMGHQEESEPVGEEPEYIDNSLEGECKAVLQVFVMSQVKRDQALWILKYQILGEKKSRRFGDFENICRRLYQLGVMSFKPNTAREYALAYNERLQIEAARVIKPEQYVSTTALLGLRQFKEDIELKKGAIAHSLSTKGAITRDAIDEYAGKVKSSSRKSTPSAPAPSTPVRSRPSSSPSTPPPPSPEQKEPPAIVALSTKPEIQEGDLVEALPGAEYIDARKSAPIPPGTKGSVQSVNQPIKQCIFIEKDDPEKMGYVLLEHLSKVVSPPNYTQVVEDTSHQQAEKIDKIMEGYKQREAEKEKENNLLKQKLKEAEQKIQKFEEAVQINEDLKQRFWAMAENPESARAQVIRETVSILQRYEDEFQITDIHPDIKSCFADLWDSLRKVAFDPVEDKALS